LDPHPIGWKPFVAYAMAKEAGTHFTPIVMMSPSFFMQSLLIFYDELELDGG
jgi:hypothetical protein